MVDVCVCVLVFLFGWFHFFNYMLLFIPREYPAKTRLKILTGRYHPRSTAGAREDPASLDMRRQGYFNAAVLNDEAEFGPVNAQRSNQG